MSLIANSFTRALRSLSQPGILWHLVWPTLASIAVWLVVAWQFGGELSAWLAAAMGNFSWFAGWFGEDGAAGAASVTAGVLLVFLMLPLMYATAATIVAVFAPSSATKSCPGAVRTDTSGRCCRC
jgi:CysZ protein